MSRWKAAGFHLSISFCIAFVVILLLFVVWYPPPYFHAAGAGKLEMILVGVDLTLGPLLTLIVFKAGKKGMRFDLAAIGTVQAVALLYGMSIILSTRPVFLVGSIDRFVLVSANEVSASDLAQGRQARYRSLSWTGPRLVAAKMPTDKRLKSDLLSSAMHGKDIERIPKYYVDYASQVDVLLRHAAPASALAKKGGKAAKTLTEWLTKHRLDQSQVVWLPVTARFSDVTMILDKQTGEPLGALDIDPWQ